MMARLDLTKLGAGLLAAGPLFLQFGQSKATWWVGFVFTIAGPVLMAVKRKGSTHA